MKKIQLYIFGLLAVLISVLAVATLSYAGGSKIRIPLVTSGIEAIVENLVTPTPRTATIPTNDVTHLLDFTEETTSTEAIAVLKTPESWKKFSFKNYTFKIPGDWEPVWPSIEKGYTTLLFQDANGATVANIWSPAPTTGYPGHVITLETRKTISGEDHDYKALLMHGDPDSVESNLDMIVVSKIGYESDMEAAVFDPGYGMQIFSRYDEDASEIFEEIYDSLKIEDEWQTFTGDHFRFEYPSEWTVTTDAGVGHRWIEFFGVDNKRVAFMQCPIPETGYEGYEMSERNRTLEIGDMKYALDYWHGESIDGSGDLELLLMEMMTPPEGLEGGFGGSTCAMTAEQPGLTKTFKRIHQSLTVR